MLQDINSRGGAALEEIGRHVAVGDDDVELVDVADGEGRDFAKLGRVEQQDLLLCLFEACALELGLLVGSSGEACRLAV